MSWVKLDDSAPDHPKLIGLGDDAFRLWIGGLCYCSRHGTDGLIPAEALPKLAPPRKAAALAASLVARGLWHARGVIDCVPGSYEVHDFLEYHPTAEASKAKRKARAEAGRLGGIRSGEVRSKPEANPKQLASTMSNPSARDPVPSRPDPRSDPPVAPQGAPRAEGSGLVAGAAPAPDLIAIAQQLADEGSGLGKSVVERAAQGRLPTPGQRDALRRIRDERAEAGRSLPPPPGTPKRKAREPTRGELEALEREHGGMSPAAGPACPPPPLRYIYAAKDPAPADGPPDGQQEPARRVDVVALLGGSG